MRKAGKIAFVFILISFIIVMGLLAVLVLRDRAGRRLAGSWSTEVTLDSGREAAREWLMGADEGDRIDPGEFLETPKLTLTLQLEADGGFKRTLEEGSYEAAENKLREELGEAFFALLSLRAEKAGHGELTAEEAKKLTEEELGMSFPEFLEEEGVKLLPPLEELRLQYNARGSYRLEKDVIHMTGLPDMHFLADEELLVLKDEKSGVTMLYHKEEQP